ncbi:MAG TPA: LacI family transcriptional regulator [Microbacteriaceae bacterium]|nr:LacI family transcriptional regulator [Microbacteriaceae bacterium]
MSGDGDAPRRHVTRVDVARYAGVSPAVVSYTVNSGPKTVAPATRARVQEAIRVLGYRPNAAARALKVGLTKMFGVVVPDSSNPFFAELGRALEDAAAARGYALIVVNFDGPPEKVAASIRSLALRQVDGMLIAAQVSMPAIAAIGESGTRAVLLNQFSAVDGVSAIGPDLYDGARQAVRHLIAHGHERIGFVGNPDGNDLRRRGWSDALAAAGLDEGPTAGSSYSREGGYAAGRELLASANRPTAVFVSSDMQAIGVLRVMHEAGLTLPRDMAIVSFDGSPESEYSWPALTTLQQPVRDMAVDAIERLIAPTESAHFTRYLTKLVVRQSCGCGFPTQGGE